MISPIVADGTASRALLLVSAQGVYEANTAEGMATAQAHGLAHQRETHATLQRRHRYQGSARIPVCARGTIVTSDQV